MTFQQIRYVVEIARCGSISKATKTLFVAQPYLSNLLKDLENEIGVTIFTRSSRGVELTDDGREFISYVQPLLDQRDKILDLYAGQRALPSFMFSVSLQRFPFVNKAFVELFREKNPEKFEIHLREVGMYRVINDVAEKKSALGILYVSDINESFIRKTLGSKGLEFNEIASFPPYVYFGSHHPLAARDAVNIEEMQEYPYIVFEEEAFVSLDYSEEVLLHGFQPNSKRIFVEDRATMINLLTNTDGFSTGSGILPEKFAGEWLVSRPIADAQSTVRLGYVKLPSVVLNEDYMRFLQLVEESVKRP